MQETFGNVRKEICSLDLRGHLLINLNDKSLVCANVCMSVWQQVLFLTSSKKAIVHPVYKGNGKDPRDPASYRPVAMLNHRFQP